MSIVVQRLGITKMYFPVGWPRVLNIPQLGQCSIRQVVCNRDKILFAILTDDCLSVWFCKPCVPIVLHRRSCESVEDIGTNELVEWRPDSSMLVVATSGGYLLFYKVGVVAEHKGLYEQLDSPHPNLRRDSAELFIKEVIPPLLLTLEEACKKCFEEVVDNLCIVFDLKEFGLSCMDYQVIKNLIWLLSRHYPERLGVCLVLNAPALFSGCWGIIKGWLDENTSSKVMFVNSEEELCKYLIPDILPDDI